MAGAAARVRPLRMSHAAWLIAGSAITVLGGASLAACSDNAAEPLTAQDSGVADAHEADAAAQLVSCGTNVYADGGDAGTVICDLQTQFCTVQEGCYPPIDLAGEIYGCSDLLSSSFFPAGCDSCSCANADALEFTPAGCSDDGGVLFLELPDCPCYGCPPARLERFEQAA
jgi:hypothetical protein